MTKKPSFGNEGSTVTLAPQPPAAHQTAKEFVKGKIPMRRLMLEIPAELHHRMKVQCALQKVKMAEVARDLFENRFPKDSKN